MSEQNLPERMMNLEMAVSHLEHNIDQMHSVLLSVQEEIKAIRDQMAKMERRITSAAETPEQRDPLEERPPHY